MRVSPGELKALTGAVWNIPDVTQCSNENPVAASQLGTVITYARPATRPVQKYMQIALDLKADRLRQFYQLTKPRVLALIVFELPLELK